MLVLTVLVISLVSLVTVYYYYYKRCYKYWTKKGLPSAKPKFPLGNLGPSSAFGRKSVYIRLRELYKSFKRQGHKHAGIYFFNGPIYFPIDPEIIKRILVTDFDHFVDRGVYGNGKKLPLSKHIFSMKGDDWKKIRGKMTPSFTSGKLKNIYGIAQNNCLNLITEFRKQVQGNQVFDIKDLLLRFAADTIGSSSFGIDCDGLKNTGTEFSRMVDRISNHSSWKLIKVALVEGLQNPGNIEKIAYSDQVIQDFFSDLVTETVRYREEHQVVRNDFLQMLIELKNENCITLSEVISQSYLFFIAGFKTSAFTMCYCLHELAHNFDIQMDLRHEIYTKLGGHISDFKYEDLNSLPLLDKIVKETMRKYPPLPVLNRICVKKYQIPGTDVTIEKNTPVIIPVFGLHRDPEYFPEPLKFNPERFSDDYFVVPFTYLPFGCGPRNCIGLRFGLLKTKLAVASLISQFKFIPSGKTPKQLPIDRSTTSILYNVRGGIFLKVSEI